MFVAVVHHGGAVAAERLARGLSPIDDQWRGPLVVTTSGNAALASRGGSAAPVSASGPAGALQFGAPASDGSVGSGTRVAIGPDGIRVVRGVPCGQSVYLAHTDEFAVVAGRFDVVEAATRQAGRGGDVDRDWAAGTALLLRPEGHRTAQRGIERLVAGEERDVFVEGSRRRFEGAPLAEQAFSPDEAADALWSTLRDAVRRQLAGARRVAILLSGGLDSSGVLAALIAEARGASIDELRVLTWHFSAAGNDDRPYVDALAKAYGIVPLPLLPRDASATAQDGLILAGLPYPMLSASLEIQANAYAASLGADVLVTGAGGDEVLAGPLQALSQLLFRSPLATVRHVLALEVPWPTTRRGRLLDYLLRPLLRPLLPPSLRLRGWLAREQGWVSWTGPYGRAYQERRGRAAAARRMVPRNADERLARVVSHSGFDTYADFRTQLEYALPAQAASGVRRVDPLLDAELVRFLASLPPKLLQDGALHRGLWRRALRGHVPDFVRLRRTKGDLDGAFGLSQAYSSAEFQEFIDVPRELVALGIVNATPWVTYRDAVRNAPDDEKRGAALGFIYAACTVEHWLRARKRAHR